MKPGSAYQPILTDVIYRAALCISKAPDESEARSVAIDTAAFILNGAYIEAPQTYAQRWTNQEVREALGEFLLPVAMLELTDDEATIGGTSW